MSTTTSDTGTTVLQAINAAMRHELMRDEAVVVLGEDVARLGGIFRTTEGLLDQFGPGRVIDTPLDEKGIVGHATGMALYGLKPIVEIQFSGFIHDAFEQIMYCASKYRWLTAGQWSCQMVIRAPSFGGIKGGYWHSQSPEGYYVHGGGMKIVVPSTVEDAYRLTIAAIRDPDPVLVLEPVPLYRALSAPLEEDGRPGALGEAHIVRPGSDVTVLTYGPMRHLCVRVADALAGGGGPDVEVVDLRSLVPLDVDTVVESARETGRVVIVHEAPLSLGFGAELAALVQERAFGSLKAPIDRVAGHDVPYGFSTGDEYYRPDERRVRNAILRQMEFEF